MKLQGRRLVLLFIVHGNMHRTGRVLLWKFPVCTSSDGAYVKSSYLGSGQATRRRYRAQQIKDGASLPDRHLDKVESSSRLYLYFGADLPSLSWLGCVWVKQK